MVIRYDPHRAAPAHGGGRETLPRGRRLAFTGADPSGRDPFIQIQITRYGTEDGFHLAPVRHPDRLPLRRTFDVLGQPRLELPYPNVHGSHLIGGPGRVPETALCCPRRPTCG